MPALNQSTGFREKPSNTQSEAPRHMRTDKTLQNSKQNGGEKDQILAPPKFSTSTYVIKNSP
uniref:Uncharacterized protein n=1 Tax=Rhizophora mucronata TaxID=61149 RepID=A0A2P2QLH7_RHIMU